MNPAVVPDHTVTPLNLIDSAEQELTRTLGFGVPRPLLKWLTGLDQTEVLWKKVQEVSGASIFDRVLTALGVQYRCPDPDVVRIPRTGPAVFVSNHPFGLLDGLILGALLHRRRNDFRILSNSILASVPEINRYVIAVSVIARQTRANASALRSALKFVESGGALVIFPAGEVSAPRGFPPVISDAQWNNRVLQLAVAAHAPVVPVYVSGRNSTAFQCAGFVHPMLRTALLSRELMNKRGHVIDVAVGRPIPAERLKEGGIDRVTEYVRERTYLLGERRSHPRAPLFRRAKAPIADPLDSDVLVSEVAALSESAVLVRRSGYIVYLSDAARIPRVLEEIGRLREITFRTVGEGTGQRRDLDSFDSHYEHLFLWSERKREIVGAYRIGRVDRLLRRSGADALYSHRLFQFTPEFLERISSGLELGRSFIRQEYQRSIYPLYYLWRGIGAFIERNPSYRYLFGPVSISNDYSRTARELIVQYFRGRDAEGARPVRPRRPFNLRPFGARAAGDLAARVTDVEELSALVADLEPDGKGIPVLLRHYLGLGAEVLEFNVDRAFANALDALIIVDLTRSNNAVLEKYMGREGLEKYLAHQSCPSATTERSMSSCETDS